MIGKIKLLKFSPLKHLNFLIAAVLIGANLVAWTDLLLAVPAPYIVDPIRDLEIVTLLDYIRSGGHSDETREITLTELEAEQIITQYLRHYPQIPFEHPKVDIIPAYVAGEGDATIAACGCISVAKHALV